MELPSSDPDACCYQIAVSTCCGRPIFVGGIARVARAVRRLDWS